MLRLLTILLTLTSIVSFNLKPSQTKVSKPQPNTKNRVLNNVAIGLAITTFSALPAIAEAPVWILPTKSVLDIGLLYMEFAFLCRVVLSWYPKVDLNKLPQNLVAWPTEPILKPTRGIVPPAFGVDVSPIVWIMLVSFIREILFGQQGLFNMIINQSS
mmetsp:Transcript_9139/g.13717  ORF Transcript_9139/g.13717 Transcript_9139/m.13717 type:complete len:158 (+) Transcript_9139:49-522(+)